MKHDLELDTIIAAQPYPPKNGNGRWRIDPRFAIPLVLSLTGWLVTLMLAYGAINTRLALVEARQQENDRRMQRVEDKLDMLLRRP